ncbi:hypothetical protein M885DRAFT_131765 [Pelagophyceae sp. CCMP2097]|nr:hypothetical protein M885DRAFT_131765 [Pelagophyceae sp. CCMP2097]
MSDNVEAAVHVPQKRNFGPAWHKDGASFGKPPVTAVQPHDVAPLRGIFGSGPTRAESSQSWDARPRVTEKVRYKYTAAELLAARRPAVVLESLRLALPAEIVSNDPLEPSCTQQRPSHSQIQEKWDALRRTEPRKPPGVAHQRASFEAPPPRATLAAGSTTALPEQSGPSRWERGMSLPQAGTEKLWDEPDDETFGDHGDATALSSWCVRSLEREGRQRRFVRRKRAGTRPQKTPLGERGDGRTVSLGAAFVALRRTAFFLGPRRPLASRAR